MYEILFYNHDGSLYKYLTRWDRLEVSQRINNPWNHSIQLRVGPYETLGTEMRELARDTLVLVYKNDPITDVRYLIYEGIHQTTTEQVQANGNIFFNLYGAGYTKLLDRRVVVPDEGEENVVFSGKAESVIKDFVAVCMVSPTDAARIMPNFNILSDQGRGGDVSYTARYTNLDSVIGNLAESGEVDYGVTGSEPPGNFYFEAKPIWGEDRRLSNSEGNIPVVFDLEYNNMMLPILSTNRRYEKNFIYAGGQGQGINREIVTISDADAILESPWNRCELFVNASHNDTTEGVYAAAASALEERGAKVEFDFEVKQTAGTRWPRDWQLGDYVSARYKGREFEKQITEINIIVSGAESSQSEERITVALEDI